MRNEINETFLIVLKKDNRTNRIKIDYEPIINPFDLEIKSLKELCKNKTTQLEDILLFLNRTFQSADIFREYKYSKCLVEKYQEFTFSFEEVITQLKENISNGNIGESKLNDCKNDILDYFVFCTKCYSIELTYTKCEKNPEVLTYSHRKTGWSNPVFKISENLSVEFLTDFGYGDSSYFYSLLKYKNIEISCFSDWVNYEIAGASEIIRYSKSYTWRFKSINSFNEHPIYKPIIENSYWSDAMEFVVNACNLSLESEEEFVRKYIVGELEIVVSGIEGFLNGDSFVFIDENKRNYKSNLLGYTLNEFKGEKISGALEFINKIFDLKDITLVDEFIERVEKCNQRIQPVLSEELKNLDENIPIMKLELENMKLICESLIPQNEIYDKEINEIKNQIVLAKKIKRKEIDASELFNIISEKFPEYKLFVKKFDDAFIKRKELVETIKHMEMSFRNINIYLDNIIFYFKKSRV